MPRVGVLHAPFGAANLRDIARAAAGRVEPVVVFRNAVAARHPDVVAAARRLFAVEVADEDELPQRLAALRLDGLTTFHDEELDVADRVAAVLGLPGAGTVADPWDKLVQRKRLAGAGLTAVRATAVDDRAGLRTALAAIGTPCVLKPRRGVSGSGIAFLDGETDVAHQLATRRRWRGLLLESRLPDGRHPAAGTLADFVSVETLSTGDGHRPLAVFDKAAVDIRRRAGTDGADAVSVTGDVTPSRLDAGTRAAVQDYVGRCLDALGVRWRVTHTEVRLTADGPELVEVNGRVGGHLNRLLRLVGGPDLVAAALCAATGTVPALPDTAPTGFAMGLFPPFPRRGGVVRSAVSRADLRTAPGVVSVDEVANRGDRRSDTGYRMANLTLRAGSGAELDEYASLARQRVAELFAADYAVPESA